MQEIETINNEHVADIQTVSTATAAQSASMKEIAGSCDELSRLAQELHASLLKFRI